MSGDTPIVTYLCDNNITSNLAPIHGNNIFSDKFSCSKFSHQYHREREAGDRKCEIRVAVSGRPPEGVAVCNSSQRRVVCNSSVL